MDNFKIFIDTDTEITFILEKILRNTHERIVLIVPDRSSFLSSITNLRIVKKIIDKSNKLLLIVTLDTFGSKLAQQAGFHVVSRVGEVDENDWNIVQKAKFDKLKSTKKKGKKSKIDLNLDVGENGESLITFLKKETELTKNEESKQEKNFIKKEKTDVHHETQKHARMKKALEESRLEQLKELEKVQNSKLHDEEVTEKTNKDAKGEKDTNKENGQLENKRKYENMKIGKQANKTEQSQEGSNFHRNQERTRHSSKKSDLSFSQFDTIKKK